jgi:hypothetical protein
VSKVEPWSRSDGGETDGRLQLGHRFVQYGVRLGLGQRIRSEHLLDQTEQSYSKVVVSRRVAWGHLRSLAEDRHRLLGVRHTGRLTQPLDAIGHQSGCLGGYLVLLGPTGRTRHHEGSHENREEGRESSS